MTFTIMGRGILHEYAVMHDHAYVRALLVGCKQYGAENPGRKYSPREAVTRIATFETPEELLRWLESDTHHIINAANLEPRHRSFGFRTENADTAQLLINGRVTSIPFPARSHFE